MERKITAKKYEWLLCPICNNKTRLKICSL
ncbi:cysteine-rich KTR domain-containing protein [Blautia producta]